MNFKQRLQQPKIVLAPGVYDPFTALLVEQGLSVTLRRDLGNNPRALLAT